jgi:serine/threonine protein kinase
MRPVQPGSAPQPELADEDAIRRWLDALASGSCNESAFLQAMHERFSTNPEANWEVLSQLDQHYRRGRIPAETFRTVKTALAESALGLATPVPAAPRSSAPAIDVAAANIAAANVAAPKIAVVDISADAAALDAAITRGIPVARDAVIGARVEHTDTHNRREESHSFDAVDALGEPKPGSVLRRRYRLEVLLGQGGMGPIFQAVDEYRLDSPGSQRLAVKILHPAVVKRAELLAELRREFQSLQLLSHPNIVRVFEFDRDGPLVFFTMELLSGATLSRVLQVRKLTPFPKDQAFAAIRDLGAALAYAHSRGVVHGDLNPRNIFITGQGELRILGFPGAHKTRPNSPASDHDVTLPNAASGYASCQVLEGERPDARDDVFALACLAYLLLSGEHPLQRKTAIEARSARLIPRAPAHLSHRQWQVLRAGLRWERDGRPNDVEQWLSRLDLSNSARRLPPLSDLLEAPPYKKPKFRWAAALAIAAAALIAAAFWFVSQRGMLPQVESTTSIQEPALPAATTPAPPVPTAPPVSTATPAAQPPSASSPTTPTQNSPRTATAPPPVASAPAVSAPVASAPARSAPPAPEPPAAAPGSSKVELAADTLDVPSGEPSAQVAVHRKGSLRGETSFTWWTESGTAKPGVDFSAVVPQLAHIGDGKSSVSLSIPLSNAPHAQSKSFYVVIDHTEGGAALAGRTLTMVTLQPPN